MASSMEMELTSEREAVAYKSQQAKNSGIRSWGTDPVKTTMHP